MTEYGIGDELCACRLLSKCGEGACGEVWLAEDVIGTRVALKILRGRFSDREIAGLKNCRACDHPNLLKIRHVEVSGDKLLYTMDAADDLNAGAGGYLPDTLANRLDRYGRLSEEEVLGMIDGLLAGLEELHGRGLVHRDIKPDNILRVHGRVTLADIGLVAASGAHTLAGTPGFISPELLSGRGTAEPSDDFYALSKVVYCALTGLPPREYPAIPGEMTISIDPRLSRAMRAGCTRRIASAAEFRRFMDGETPASPSGTGAARRPVAGWKRCLTVAVPLLLLAAAGAAAWPVLRERTIPREVPPEKAAEMREPAAAALPGSGESRTRRALELFADAGLFSGKKHIVSLLTHQLFFRRGAASEVTAMIRHTPYPDVRQRAETLKPLLEKWTKDPDEALVRARQRYWHGQKGDSRDLMRRMLTEDPVMQMAAVNQLLKEEWAKFRPETSTAKLAALIALQEEFTVPEER